MVCCSAALLETCIALSLIHGWKQKVVSPLKVKIRPADRGHQSPWKVQGQSYPTIRLSKSSHHHWHQSLKVIQSSVSQSHPPVSLSKLSHCQPLKVTPPSVSQSHSSCSKSVSFMFLVPHSNFPLVSSIFNTAINYSVMTSNASFHWYWTTYESLVPVCHTGSLLTKITTTKTVQMPWIKWSNTFIAFFFFFLILRFCFWFYQRQKTFDRWLKHTTFPGKLCLLLLYFVLGWVTFKICNGHIPALGLVASAQAMGEWWRQAWKWKYSTIQQHWSSTFLTLSTIRTTNVKDHLHQIIKDNLTCQIVTQFVASAIKTLSTSHV